MTVAQYTELKILKRKLAMTLTREVTCIFNLISECCLLLFNVQLFLLFFLILFPFFTV